MSADVILALVHIQANATNHASESRFLEILENLHEPGWARSGPLGESRGDSIFPLDFNRRGATTVLERRQRELCVAA
jgi:hypothetical protein